MKKATTAILIISAITFLFSCGLEIQLPQAKPYTVISEDDSSISGRTRKGVFVISAEAKTYEELAQTAMKAAMEHRRKTGSNMAYAFLEMSKETSQQGQPLAIARFAPDGKGLYSDSWKWQVLAAREYPDGVNVIMPQLEIYEVKE